MKTIRTVVPSLLLAALVSTGCWLISGQWVVDYHFATPLHVINSALSKVAVDLNTVSLYNDHKKDLKDVVDLALVGDIHNNGGASTNVEAWIVPAGGTNFVTASAVRAGGSKLWGPLTVGAGATVKVDWNKSAALFSGRKLLVDEIKGDGVFDLYVIGSVDPFDFTLTNGVLLAVVSAGK